MIKHANQTTNRIPGARSMGRASRSPSRLPRDRPLSSGPPPPGAACRRRPSSSPLTAAALVRMIFSSSSPSGCRPDEHAWLGCGGAHCPRPLRPFDTHADEWTGPRWRSQRSPQTATAAPCRQPAKPPPPAPSVAVAGARMNCRASPRHRPGSCGQSLLSAATGYAVTGDRHRRPAQPGWPPSPPKYTAGRRRRSLPPPPSR